MGTIDPIWEEIHSTREWGQYPSENVIRFVARNYYVAKRGNIKILDFGIGGGSHTWYLAREGFDTYGFDGSPSAVKRVENRLKNESLQAHLKCAAAQDVFYDENFFDAVIDSFCVYANPAEDIKLMYRKILGFLKPCGKLLTLAFGTNTTGYGTGKEIEEDTYTDMTEGNLAGRGLTHFYTKENFIELLKTVGFKNVVCDVNTYTDNNSVVEIFIVQGEK